MALTRAVWWEMERGGDIFEKHLREKLIGFYVWLNERKEREET